MSLVRFGIRRLTPVKPICFKPISFAVRFNSTVTPPLASTESTTKKTPKRFVKVYQKPSLTAKVFPFNQESILEEDVDNWLSAIQRLKNGHAPETAAEIYIDELTRPAEYLQPDTELTEDQIAEQEKFQTTKIPLLSDPVVDNLTNLIMRHGKKSKARKIVSRALYIVFLKLRQDPVIVLRDTLESLAPLLDTKVLKTGTAKNKVVPFPLTQRKRYRYAILWILDAAEKKKSPDYSVRLAEEIIAAYEGKSSGYEKRVQMHKTAIAQRAYVRL